MIQRKSTNLVYTLPFEKSVNHNKYSTVNSKTQIL